MLSQICADFETTTDPEDCRVWSWGVYEIGGGASYWGKSIAAFFRFCAREQVEKCFFHNLQFDGKFIVDYLLKSGYAHTKERRPRGMEFSTLVSDKGQFYQIVVSSATGWTMTIWDSLKLFPLSVAGIGSAYFPDDAELAKGDIDYDTPRPVGYDPTAEELDYLARDVSIVGRAIEIGYSQGLTKMTIGANALRDYKERVTTKLFKKWFPLLPPDVDAFVRASYRGGFTYAAEKWRGVVSGAGISVDYNSMYPSVMDSDYLYPVGYPEPFEGRYEPDEVKPLFVQMLTVEFSVKPDALPMIQVRGTGFYGNNEYVKETVEPVTICLTSVDLELFERCYDYDVISYDGGCKFEARRGHDLFGTYYAYWGEKKQTSTGGERQIAKLYCNNLYGKFGTNPNSATKSPVLDSDGVVRWIVDESEERDSVYIPIAAFTTAYARKELFIGILSNFDRFMYCDTDSMHLIGTEEPEGIRLHPTDFHAWDVEEFFTRSKHLRAKAYVLEHEDGRLKVKCAGMTDAIKKLVTMDNFEFGFSNLDENGEIIEGAGKLTPVSVPGGVVLVDRPYILHP